jgi:uncharacterized protein YkwD
MLLSSAICGSSSKSSGSSSKSKSSGSSSSSGSSGSAGKHKSKYLKMKKIFDAINAVRKAPAKYADKIQKLYIAKMDKKNKKLHTGWKRTFTEGLPAMEEAVKFLKKAKPVAPLKLDMGMSWAAFKHSVYMLTKKKLDHTGKGGSSMNKRLEEYGDWQTTIGENIFKTTKNTRNEELMLLEFIIDDGVKNRGHRANVMKKDFKNVGIGIASDGSEDWITLDFSGGFKCKKCGKITKANRDEMGWSGPVPSNSDSSSLKIVELAGVITMFMLVMGLF